MKKAEGCQLLFIVLAALLGALMQANGFLNLAHLTKVQCIAGIYFLYGVAFLYFCISGRLKKEETAVTFMVLLGILIRLSYILMSGLYDRQHDAGVYTGMGTDYINPGHIGYIEYIYKFHMLPQINPYQLFGYYHPPLHHLISFLWLQLNIALGVAEDLAFENLQVLPFIYSCLLMTVTWKILKTLDIKGSGLYIGLSFVVFHPATILMGGSVNNDMLTILFMALLMLYSLRWIRDKSRRNIVILALCLGFGMITKLNAAVLAIPLAILFLMHFFKLIRGKDKNAIMTCVKNYVIFLAISVPIGFSWIIRNLVKYSEKPGVPVPGVTSPMYTENYSLWQRLGIPSIASLHLDFPFHPIASQACANTWAIMMHTSLFGEEYPVDLSDELLVMCQLLFKLALLGSILCALFLIITLLSKRTRLEDRIYLLVGYIMMLVSFAAFVIIYPYTCSSDYRYVAICSVFTSIALGFGNKYYLQERVTEAGKERSTRVLSFCMHITNASVIAVLIMVNIVYLFWARW